MVCCNTNIEAGTKLVDAFVSLRTGAGSLKAGSSTFQHGCTPTLTFPVPSQFYGIRTETKLIYYILIENSPPPLLDGEVVFKRMVRNSFRYGHVVDFDSSFSTSNWFQFLFS